MSNSIKSSTAVIDTKFDRSAFEEALAAEEKNPNKGSKVSGVVVKVTNNEIFIDINSKAEGRIPCSEFGTQVPSKGDTIDVVYRGEDADGNIRVSFSDLQNADIEDSLEEGNVVKGKVLKLITRKREEDERPIPVGFQVELGPDIIAFSPMSQIDVYPEQPESYIGCVLDFRIERIEMKGRYQNIVVNRRKLLEEAVQGKQREFFATHEVGDVVKGKVRGFLDFGAFIDLGGFSGLLHSTNIAWQQVKKPQDYVELGEELDLQISDMDPDKRKISLSLKALQPNPWDDIMSKYQVEQIVTGQVMRLQVYGAFIELEPGIEGLVHVSEMSWLKQIKHPKEILSVGEQVKVKILELNLDSRRIRLGLRQTQPNPWLSIAERYTVGTNLTLPVKNVIKNGAFLVLEEGIDGFLSQDDLSWAKHVNIDDVAKVGETLEVQVLRVEAEDRRIRLGVKQLENNPWQELKNFKKGTVIEGAVVSKTDFGIFVAVNGGVEGLVHKNDFTSDREADREELLRNYKKGDTVRTLIVEIDEDKRRLGLSIKALENREEKQSMKQYLSKSDSDEAGCTLGDIVGGDIVGGDIAGDIVEN